ncbi:uncharacterized protein LOC119691852, partial [Plutella xylostella]|uniref:uncharacterized protein LOC119691852 n=1 Tax=Plutella xylostella TaxID=51655 RepID=UPI0020321FC8
MSMMSRRGLEEEPAPVRTKPSQSQQEKLLELFAAKPWLCAGPPRSGYARDRNRAAWQDIAAELNADLSGCHKTWKRWAKFWSDKRSSIKKKVRQRTIERLHATADAELDSELTGIEEQMLALMGGEAAVLGDRDPTLNPYIPHVSVEYGSNEDLNTPSQSLDQCSSPAAPASPPAPASPAPPLAARARRCLRALARRHPALRGDPAFRDLLALLPAPESERRSAAAGDSDELDDERADSDEPGEAAGSEPAAVRVKTERADSVERGCGCDQVTTLHYAY